MARASCANPGTRQEPAGGSVPTVSAAIPVHNDIDRFLDARLEAAKVAPTPLTSDLEFLRRVSIDATGLIPTADEIRAYLADPAAKRRAHAIDRLLASPSWADNWVSYWQDVLAENPGILKPDLNNTGPFRWWLHQSFTDNLPIDRIAAELIEMDGSLVQGGPAGFAQATLNDAPMAAKADIIAQAFLGQKLGLRALSRRAVPSFQTEGPVQPRRHAERQAAEAAASPAPCRSFPADACRR